MADDDLGAKRAWIARVLGATVLAVSPAGGPGPSAEKSEKILPIWISAREEVGGQIAKLQNAMRGTKYPLLEKLADRGLNGITGRLQVGLQVQLTELDGADSTSRPKAAAKVRVGISDFRTFLKSNRIVPLIEKNPFGVPVTLHASLGAALDAIERSLPA